MKAISWNVNGIRAILGKNFLEFLKEENPDMIGLQEVKAQWEQVSEKDKDSIAKLGYKVYWNGAKRPGYSGTAVLSKIEPKSIIYGIDCEVLDCEDIKEYDETIHSNEEGRVTALEFDNFYFVTVYTPNSKDDLSRLDYRYHSWDKIYLKFLKKLEETKPVVTCGDYNVAHTEIDLARPAANTMSAGFTKEEREGMDNFLARELIDTFRYLNPGLTERYTWWSYRGGARSRNVGWRIDYFLISANLAAKMKDAFIRDQVLGSDHCPVGVILDF